MRYAIGDLHLGHENILKFKNYDGSKLRPWTELDKMHEDMVQWWN